MRKIVFALLFLLLLCGCEKTSPEYLISSMGFDNENGKYDVYFEAIIINSENQGQMLKLLNGKGESIDKAVEQIRKSCTQPLLLSHCGVIIIGENISKKQFEDIKNYCYDTDPVTLSAYFVKAKNAKELLSAKPVSSACVGYDILGLIKQNGTVKSRFFEILNSGPKVQLPTISVKNTGVYFGGKHRLFE